MTRILAEMVGASEHGLRRGIMELEKVSGHPNADIRLTAEVVQATKRKLAELGLDPHDTNGRELYASLQDRLKRDDAKLVASLQQVAADADDVLGGVTHALQALPLSGSCFALKNTAAKRLLKKFPPKAAMKQLGYRSFESMLKHEAVPGIFAVAWSVESATWRKKFVDQYSRLKPSDFETRAITIIHPKSAKWVALGSQMVRQHRHSVLSFPELGAIVLLPLPNEEQPPAFTTTTLILALRAINSIRSASSFLRLHQVRPDFGQVLQAVASDEPQLHNVLLDQPVAWRVIQRFYARFKQAFNPEVFELAIGQHDLTWHGIERSLERLEPSLAFWRGTEHLSYVHDHQPVSLNIIDVALGYCNQLPFERRIVHHMREALQEEIQLHYLQPQYVEQIIRSQLQPDLATETVSV